MTDAEKAASPQHTVTGGIVRVSGYKEAFRRAWDSASREDQELVTQLPNFDADIFFDISGIDVRKELL